MTTGLSRLLMPSSIAVVGVSTDPNKHGGRIVANLRRFGYGGDVMGVNSRRPNVPGVEVFARLEDLPAPPDLVVVVVPAEAVVEVVRSAASIGAGGAVVVSGGFSESGDTGHRRQQELLAISRETGFRLVGPNSAGIIDPGPGVVASFLTCLERPKERLLVGSTALISQSGGVLSYVQNLAAERGRGLALSVSTGNEVDVSAGELLEYAIRRPDVRAVAMFLETVRDGPLFLVGARLALELAKPIVVCKVGGSDVGRRLVQTHSGALAGSARRYDAVFEDLGITVVDTPEELFEVAEVLSCTRPVTGATVGVVTHSGGTAALLADTAERAGVELPQPSAELQRSIEPYLALGAAGNPADLGGIISGPARFGEVVRAFADSGSFDLVVAASTPHPQAHSSERAKTLAEIAATSTVPVINLWLAGDIGRPGLDILTSANVAVTEDVRSLGVVVGGLVRRWRAHRTASGNEGSVILNGAGDAIAQAKRSLPTGLLTEVESKRLMESVGFTVVKGAIAGSAAEAKSIASRMGYPVVMKLVSRDVIHKNAIGGVRLGVADAHQVATAWDCIVSDANRLAPTASVEGVLVEEYVPGIEAFLGVVNDPTFGPLVLCGVGGEDIESRRDIVLALPPISLAAARAKIAKVDGITALVAKLDTAQAFVDGLAMAMAKLSAVALAFGDSLDELDLNPLAFTNGEWRVLDAVVRLADGPAGTS